MDNRAVFVVNPLADSNKQIRVPVVQELASSFDKNSSQIPQNYVRPDDEKPISSDITELPIIDISLIVNTPHHHEDRQSELHNLAVACRDWGFFQIVNHGVNKELIEKMKRECVGFFGQTLEERMKFKQIGDDGQGYGQAFIASQEQTLDWGDFLYLQVLPSEQRLAHLWNGMPHSMRETVDSYGKEMERLVLQIMRSFEEIMGVRSGSFIEQCKVWGEYMRINYYPPCPRPDLSLGLSPHSDASAITILLQNGDVPGLQVKKDDRWILVKPMPDALVVNIGDYMEIMTNGRYKSIQHRAVTNCDTSRMSIATFYFPARPNEVIEPATELVDPTQPAMYKKVSHGEYFGSYLSKRLEGKKFLNSYFAK